MIIRKHFCALAVIGFLSLTISVRSQDQPAAQSPPITAEKRALITELLALTEAKKLVEAMLSSEGSQMEKQMGEIVWQGVLGMPGMKALSEVQREELRVKIVEDSARVGRKTSRLILEKLDIDKLLVDVSLPLYDKYFSEGELKDLVVFYKSTTGKKLIQVSPALVTESMARTGELMMPTILEVMRQVEAEGREQATKELHVMTESLKKPAKPRSGRRRSRP